MTIVIFVCNLNICPNHIWWREPTDTEVLLRIYQSPFGPVLHENLMTDVIQVYILRVYNGFSEKVLTMRGLFIITIVIKVYHEGETVTVK